MEKAGCEHHGQCVVMGNQLTTQARGNDGATSSSHLVFAFDL
jgi:hypothetical protein